MRTVASAKVPGETDNRRRHADAMFVWTGAAPVCAIFSLKRFRFEPSRSTAQVVRGEGSLPLAFWRGAREHVKRLTPNSKAI